MKDGSNTMSYSDSVPAASIDGDTRMNLFYNGLNPTTKSHVNACSRGEFTTENANVLAI